MPSYPVRTLAFVQVPPAAVPSLPSFDPVTDFPMALRTPRPQTYAYPASAEPVLVPPVIPAVTAWGQQEPFPVPDVKRQQFTFPTSTAPTLTPPVIPAVTAWGQQEPVPVQDVRRQQYTYPTSVLSPSPVAPPSVPLAVDSQMPGGVEAFTTTNTSPWTWSFTNAAGTVLYLILQFDNGTAGATVTVTYAGVSMTLLGTRASNFSGGSGTANIYLFRLTSPATGANNFAVSFTPGGSLVTIGSAISFTGNAAIPDSGTASLNSYNGTLGTTWPLTVNSTSTGNIVVMGAIYGDGQTTVTPSGTLSARKDVNSGAFGNNESMQYQSSSAGTTSTSLTGSPTSTSWVTIGIEVRAAAGITTDQIMASINRPFQPPLFVTPARQYPTPFGPVAPVAPVVVPLILSWRDPPISSRPSTHIYPTTTGVLFVAETISLDKWWQQTAVPPQDARRQQFTYPHVTAIPAIEPITPDKWWQPVSVPPQDSRRQQFTYSAWTMNPNPIAAAEVITVDKWWHLNELPFQGPARRPDLSSPFAFQFPVVTETITVDKWYTAPGGPRQDSIRRQDLFSAGGFTALVAAPETITVDKWFNQTGRPLPGALANQYSSTAAFLVRLPVVETVTIDKWYSLTGRPLPGAAANQYSYPAAVTSRLLIIPEVVTMDKWFNRASTPVMNRAQTQYTYSSYFTDTKTPVVVVTGVLYEERIELGSFFGITVPDIDLGIA